MATTVIYLVFIVISNVTSQMSGYDNAAKCRRVRKAALSNSVHLGVVQNSMMNFAWGDKYFFFCVSGRCLGFIYALAVQSSSHDALGKFG